MAKTFSTALTEGLDSGHVSFRYLVAVTVGDTVYRIGNHTPGEWLTWDGEDWWGIGSMLGVPDFQTSQGLAADQVIFRINGALLEQPPIGYRDAASWLRDILRTDLVNRRLDCFEIYEDPGTGDVLGGFPQFAGLIDNTPLDQDKPELSIRVRSNRQAFGWSNGRTRSDSDQRRIDAEDGSFRHTADEFARNGKLPWGRKGNTPGGSGGAGGVSRSGGPGGIFDSIQMALR